MTLGGRKCKGSKLHWQDMLVFFLTCPTLPCFFTIYGRQHCRLSICSSFGRLLQILNRRQAGLSKRLSIISIFLFFLVDGQACLCHSNIVVCILAFNQPRKGKSGVISREETFHTVTCDTILFAKNQICIIIAGRLYIKHSCKKRQN